MSDIVQARPRRMGQICLTGAVVTLVIFVLAAAFLRQGAGAKTFGVGDQIALGILGLIIAGAIYLPANSRLRADDAGIYVRNVLAARTVPWSLVVAIRFDGKSPWAWLEFSDGDLLAMMALRAADGPDAIDAAARLRALRDAHGADVPS